MTNAQAQPLLYEHICADPMNAHFVAQGWPPRKEFAEKWHPKLLAHMPEVRLTILVGAYAQKHYLAHQAEKNLTETVAHFAQYLPEYFPLVHPSPLTARWRAHNPWFETEVVPELRQRVAGIIT